MATILSIAQDAAIEISLSEPNTLFGSDAPSGGKKLARHITRTCRQLAQRYDWSFLRKEQTFTTVAAEIQTNALPSDFLRFVTETTWNRTTRREVEGPLTPQDYQSEKARVNGGIRDQFIIRGTDFLIYPTPSAGDTIAYEYIKNTIGADSGSTELTEFTADTDTTLFDDELVMLGAVWRYKKSDGLDYSEEFREYEARLLNIGSKDGGNRRVSMSGDPPRRIMQPQFNEYVSE